MRGKPVPMDAANLFKISIKKLGESVRSALSVIAECLRKAARETIEDFESAK
jgi:hypothetical protein